VGSTDKPRYVRYRNPMWYMYSTSGQLILPIPLDDVMFTGIEVTMEMFYAVVVVWVCSLARPMTSVLELRLFCVDVSL